MKRLVLAVLLLSLALPSFAQDQAPEPPSGRQASRSAVDFSRHGVAAAHPLAAEAGLAILESGGNAVDAAIAVQFVLGLVEPQSSGLGGGGFALVHDARTGRSTSFDGRETAPAAARPERFLAADGRPMPFREAVLSGRSIGVPGLLPMLETMHRAHGRLPWARLAEPAIRLAEEGFPVSARLHALLKAERFLKDDPAARAYFYDAAGEPWPIGHRLKNPAYAATLRAVAEQGAKALSEGPIAKDLIAAVQRGASEAARGDLTLADLASYRVLERPVLCGPYRGWRICGMGPPSSGGLAVLQILAVLEPHSLDKLAPDSLEAVHLLAEAGRLAFADRNRYLADPDFVQVPVAGLLAPEYLSARARLIDRERSMRRAEPGTPVGAPAAAPADEQQKLSGTTHLSIVDADGNAVAMTTSIEDVFGARRMVRGFLLNNQLTDFALGPIEEGRAVANRIEPGKRPRSSMAPTLAFAPDGRLAIVTGSPGGSAIIGYVVKNLIAMIDWGLDPQAAAELPHYGSRNGPTELERGSRLEALKPALEARGHPVAVLDFTSGVHSLRRTPRGWQGGADPRREGVVRGR